MDLLRRHRIYRSGTGIQWCWWRWSDAQEPYLNRLFVFKTPWLSLSYNHIKQADVGHPHDHTATFLSVFLKGWYKEWRLLRDADLGIVKRRWFNYVRAVDWDRHRIVDVAPGGSHSLCLMGPKRREWYYHTPDGPVHWATYKEQTR
jgi:hypothetical protein